MTKTVPFRLLFSLLILAILSMPMACGFERFEPVPSALVEGLTLAELEVIQMDERLTDDERRDAIAEAVNASADEEGDRLVEFLLTFNVP